MPAALPRLALGDIVDTTLCAWESPETDIVDAMNDMYVGELPPDAMPGSAPAAPVPEGGWALDELERLRKRAWANISPPMAQMDVDVSADTELDISQVSNAAQAQPVPANLPPAAAPPQLVAPTPFVFTPPLQNPIPAQPIDLVVPRAPRMVEPTPFFFPPPSQPQAAAPAALEKKVLTVAGSIKKDHIAHPSARRTSRKEKTLVSYEMAEHLYKKSIDNNPKNTVCSFSNCRHISPHVKAHGKHMMTHAEPSFRCDWCGKVYKRLDTLNGHMKECSEKKKQDAPQDKKLEAQ